MDQHEQDDTLDLRDHLAVVRRQVWLILTTVVMVVATAMGVTVLQTPLYRSTVELVVEPFDSPNEQSALERALLGNTEMQTQREFVWSVPVAERVIEDLGLDVTPRELLEAIDVEVVTDTQVLEITATDEDPELAAAIAGSVADSYLADRREQAVERVLSASQTLEERARTIRDRIDQLTADIEQRQQGQAPIDEADPAAAEPETGELDALRQERDSLLTQLGQVTAQLSVLGSRDALVRGGGEVIRPAEVPESPASPKPVRTGILALVLGLMLGVGLAFLRDFLDDAIRDDDDAVRSAQAPVLSHIPHRSESGKDPRLVTLVDEFSPKAEAFRTLRSNVRFVLHGAERPARGEVSVGRSLAVTSAVAAEGKTTTAANLAVAAAQAGTRVLLVDADLRRPGAAKVLGIDEAPGLSELLVGEHELPEVLVDLGIANLRVLRSGRVPPNPAELLAGHAMRELHLRLEQVAELIVYDTAPVLAVADTLEVASMSTATLIVVDVREASRRKLRQAADRLRGVGAEVAGTVLNNVSPGDRYYYAYEHDEYRPAATEETEAPAAQQPEAAPEPEVPREPESRREPGATASGQPSSGRSWDAPLPPPPTTVPTELGRSGPASSNGPGEEAGGDAGREDPDREDRREHREDPAWDRSP